MEVICLSAMRRVRVIQGVRNGSEMYEPSAFGLCGFAGKGSAVIELGDPASGKKGLSMTGFKSWIAWRSAYLTRLGNMRNRLYVMVSCPVQAQYELHTYAISSLAQD